MNLNHVSLARPSDDSPQFTGRPCRLLIVDDEADLRMLLRTIFNDLGWRVDEAVDGCEALKKLQAERYDLVLLDHRMPGLTGGEVYGALSSTGISVPAVLLSAAKPIEEIANHYGIPVYLGKPFSIDELLEVVDKVSPRC